MEPKPPLPTAEEIVAALDRHPEVRDKVRALLVIGAAAVDTVPRMNGEDNKGLWPANVDNFRSFISARKPYRLHLRPSDLRGGWPTGGIPTLGDFRVDSEAIRGANEVVYLGDDGAEHLLKSRTGNI